MLVNAPAPYHRTAPTGGDSRKQCIPLTVNQHRIRPQRRDDPSRTEHLCHAPRSWERSHIEARKSAMD
jgi:hypothetical protein